MEVGGEYGEAYGAWYGDEYGAGYEGRKKIIRSYKHMGFFYYQLYDHWPVQ